MDAYISHYTPLKERKEHMIRECVREGLNPIFITDHDRDVLTPEDISKFRLHDDYKLSHVSLVLKHIDAWRKIVDNNLEYGLIFEDDAILAPGFLWTLRLYLTELPQDFDIFMINQCCNLRIPSFMLVQGKHIYSRGVDPTSWGGDGATRCIDGYIMSNKCAKKLINIYETLTTKIDIPADWWMNQLLRSIDAKAYWAEPAIVGQGTAIGLFRTSLS